MKKCIPKGDNFIFYRKRLSQRFKIILHVNYEKILNLEVFQKDIKLFLEKKHFYQLYNQMQHILHFS